MSALFAVWPGSGVKAQAGTARTTLERATRDLGSTDPDRVRTALAQLAAVGSSRVVGPISDRLRAGLPPNLVYLAIDVLAAVQQPAAAPVLRELLVHRRAAVRKRAVHALGALRAKPAASDLIDLLDDPDAGVRSAAVEALGTLGNRVALPRLFEALDRGVDGAAVAVARMARPSDLERLFEYANGRPFPPMKLAFTELLVRRDFPGRSKLKLIGMLGGLGTQAAEEFLREALETLPAGGDRVRMMRAIGDALKAAQATRTQNNGPQPAADAAAAPPPRKAAKRSDAGATK